MKEKKPKCCFCNGIIKEGHFGGFIGAEEDPSCDICFRRVTIPILKRMEKYKRSEKFEDIIALKKQVLKLLEFYGNPFSHLKDVSSLDSYNLFELRQYFLEIETMLKEGLEGDDFE